VIFVNLGALVIAVLLIAAEIMIQPISFGIDHEGNLPAQLIRLLAIFAAIIGGSVAYLLAHELTHGVMIKIFSGKKARYGFTGLYAYAGSDAYFNRNQYLAVALSPVILFGVIFLVLNLILPVKWFWMVYFLQVINISGATGDLYITYLMCKAPKEVLTRDQGVEMIFYSREKP